MPPPGSQDPPEVLDVVVVGGGVAGLAAATVLARACRTVLLVDDGEQSNRAARAHHGVFGHEDSPPETLYAQARDQLATYPQVHLRSAAVVEAGHDGGGLLRVRSADKQAWRARALVLAQGVAYELPNIPGLRELWGTKVWHCPFCDGYEHRGRRILVIGDREGVEHSSVVLPTWSRDLAWADGDDVSTRARERITAAGGVVVPAVVSIEDAPDGVVAHLVDGSAERFESVHVGTVARQRDNLASLLGCRRLPNGRVERLDENGRTTVDGVFVAGDQTDLPQQINIAVASGHRAAIGVVEHLAALDRAVEEEAAREAGR